MKKYDSCIWISDLKKSLGMIKCKIAGRPVKLQDGLDYLAHILKELKYSGNSVWWVGNGGSASIGAHLSQDLLNKLKIKSTVFTDASLLTCISNDYGYESVYLEPLKVMASSKDLLIAISSSGNSKNIVESVKFALKNGLKVVTLSGFSMDNRLWHQPADLAFFVPSKIYGQVEIAHEIILHSVIDLTYRERGK